MMYTRISLWHAHIAVLVLAAIANSATTFLLPRGWYVPTNLLLASLVVSIAYGAGLRRREIGGSTQPAVLRNVLILGSIILGIGICCVLLVAFVSVSRSAFVPTVPRQMDLRTLLYESFVRIPIGTALCEEIVFRGVLLGLMVKQWSAKPAVIINSLWFSLWHIQPTLANADATLLAAGSDLAFTLGQILVGPLVITFIGGIIFSELRLRTQSILVPVVLHATLNSVGLRIVYLSSR